MNHADHVRLLRGGVPAPGGVWADFGSGEGAFTLALADLLGTSGEIYSVDQDAGALRAACEETFRVRAEHPWPPPIALPAQWEKSFGALATGLELSTTTLPDAERELRTFLEAIRSAADA